MNTLRILIIVLLNVASVFTTEAQVSKSKYEFSFFGGYCYHFANSDLAVAPNKGYTHYGYQFLKLAYHGNPKEILGFWTCLNLGVANIERGISEKWKNMPDIVTHQELYLGTTINPFHSSKIWFHTAIGINRLHIEGMEDVQTGGGPGITFVGNSIWNKYINNLPTSGDVITGYPAFKRVAAGLNIGLSFRIWGVFSLSCDYTPVLVSPIRNDFNAGLTFIFPGN